MFGDAIVKSTGRSCIRLPTIFGQTLRLYAKSPWRMPKHFCAPITTSGWCPRCYKCANKVT